MDHSLALYEPCAIPSAKGFDNPAECSGPPHLLGPWGSAGSGAVKVGSLYTASRPPPFSRKQTLPPRSCDRARGDDGRLKHEGRRTAPLQICSEAAPSS